MQVRRRHAQLSSRHPARRKSTRPHLYRRRPIFEPNGRLEPGAPGRVVDPGADTFEVFAKWGDGPQIQLTPGSPCTVAKKHFKCEHTYKASPARGYSVDLTVEDDDGGVGKATVGVAVP